MDEQMVIADSMEKLSTNELSVKRGARDESPENAGDEQVTKRAKLTTEMDIVDSNKKVDAEGFSVQNGAHDKSVQSPKNPGDKRVPKSPIMSSWKVRAMYVDMLRLGPHAVVDTYSQLPSSMVFCDDVDLLGLGHPCGVIQHGALATSVDLGSESFGKMGPFQTHAWGTHPFLPQLGRPAKLFPRERFSSKKVV